MHGCIIKVSYTTSYKSQPCNARCTTLILSSDNLVPFHLLWKKLVLKTWKSIQIFFPWLYMPVKFDDLPKSKTNYWEHTKIRFNQWSLCHYCMIKYETHSEPSQISKMELFAKIVNGLKQKPKIYFLQKAPSQMFEWVLNRPQQLSLLKFQNFPITSLFPALVFCPKINQSTARPELNEILPTKFASRYSMITSAPIKPNNNGWNIVHKTPMVSSIEAWNTWRQ